MTRRSPERVRFLHDIMITALEGGVGYWSLADDINPLPEPELGYVSYVLFERQEESEGCYLDHSSPDCPGHLVDIEVAATGWARALRRYPNNTDVKAADRENDAGEVDAGLADIVIQLGIFNDVVYQ